MKNNNLASAIELDKGLPLESRNTDDKTSVVLISEAVDNAATSLTNDIISDDENEDINENASPPRGEEEGLLEQDFDPPRPESPQSILRDLCKRGDPVELENFLKEMCLDEDMVPADEGIEGKYQNRLMGRVDRSKVILGFSYLTGHGLPFCSAFTRTDA